MCSRFPSTPSYFFFQDGVSLRRELRFHLLRQLSSFPVRHPTETLQMASALAWITRVSSELTPPALQLAARLVNETSEAVIKGYRGQPRSKMPRVSRIYVSVCAVSKYNCTSNMLLSNVSLDNLRTGSITYSLFFSSPWRHLNRICWTKLSKAHQISCLHPPLVTTTTSAWWGPARHYSTVEGRCALGWFDWLIDWLLDCTYFR